MITDLGSIFLRSEEIIGFKDLNPIEIPSLTLTYYHHTQGVEFLQKYPCKREMRKEERGVCTIVQISYEVNPLLA